MVCKRFWRIFSSTSVSESQFPKTVCHDTNSKALEFKNSGLVRIISILEKISRNPGKLFAKIIRWSFEILKLQLTPGRIFRTCNLTTKNLNISWWDIAISTPTSCRCGKVVVWLPRYVAYDQRVLGYMIIFDQFATTEELCLKTPLYCCLWK